MFLSLPGHLPLWLSVSLLLGLGVVGMVALGGVAWWGWKVWRAK